VTTQNTHYTQTSIPLAGLEPTISAGERPQTDALDRAATGTGWCSNLIQQNVQKQSNDAEICEYQNKLQQQRNTNTKTAAVKYRLNQEIRFLYIKREH